MYRFFPKKIIIPIAVGVIVIGAVLLSIALFSSSGKQSPLPPGTAELQGFSFFNVGAETAFSDDIREALEERLGSGVQETRGTIDLRAGNRGYLRKHNPEIYRFHTQLNDQAGARVEHDIIKLTYRYALKKNTPFFYVELVFSNNSKLPLFFRIKAKKEGAGIIDEIRKKYGKPEEVTDSAEMNPTLSWKQGDDVFIIFQNEDRFGDSEYLLMIYFKKNIKAMIDIEEQQRVKAEQERKQSVRRAF
jgi:hypothetical protein